ncbi:hypothetical protein GCM10009809_41170 [Isoptericola hypogeus]|uniref:Uncharacterized protein n=1 Tax=Isoptericola hypogeus TaxID=300179 RepID=A0ABN2JWL1_9MICO
MTQDDQARGSDLDEPVPTAQADALAGLEGLDDLPLEDHVARFIAVHDALRDRLDGRDRSAVEPDAEAVRRPDVDPEPGADVDRDHDHQPGPVGATPPGPRPDGSPRAGA